MQYFMSPNVGLSSALLDWLQKQKWRTERRRWKAGGQIGGSFWDEGALDKARLVGILGSREMIWENIPVVPKFTTSSEQLCSSK